MKTTKSLMKSLTACFIVLCASPVWGQTITTNEAAAPTNTSTPFAASTTDLVNQGQSTFLSLVQNSGSAQFGSVLSTLNDGGVGAPNNQNTSFAYAPTSGSVITFTLDTSVNTLGYDITQIQSLALWGSREVQNYSVAYEVVGGSSFISLANVVNQGSASGGAQETQVLIDNGGGTPTTPIATDVAELQFTFTTPTNGALDTVYDEIDVFGSASAPVEAPEPSTALLLGVGLTAALFFHRRYRVGGN